MSLVAYASSDDSGDSDTEESLGVVVRPTPAEIPEINHVTNTASVTEIVENEISTSASSSDSLNADSAAVSVEDRPSVDVLLHGLPSPKGLDSAVIDEDDELEEEVRPKSSQVSDVQKPPAKKKQPVRITIPELKDDSDDDDDEPAVKKLKPTSAAGKTGLTALLPPPIHAAKKESNRILLPYTLTKRPKPVNAKPTVATNPQTASVSNLDKMAKLQSLASYTDSDSDDNDTEPVNFFSLDSTVKSSSSHGNVVSKSPDSSSTKSTVPTVSLPSRLQRSALNLPEPVVKQGPSLPSGVSEDGDNTVNVSQKPDIDFDAPLTFKGGVSSKKMGDNRPTHGCPAAEPYPSPEADGGDQNMYYNQPYTETCDYMEPTDDKALLQDRSFLRIQGKKRRGQEDIQIVDVKADDFTTPDELTKAITEESSYQSHRKKDNMPSGQQKRKHQITYLAFQAKEAELELKNQWADSRMTKKQTQAKYGF